MMGGENGKWNNEKGVMKESGEKEGKKGDGVRVKKKEK